MDYSNSVFWLYLGLYYTYTSFRPYHRSLCFGMLFILYFLTQISNHTCTTTGRHTNTWKSFSVHADAFAHPHTILNAVHLKLVWPSAFQLTLFPLQMAASTWEMSSSLCQRCLASSNICEVLSSSLQLRRAVSQKSRLLTRNTAKTA